MTGANKTAYVFAEHSRLVDYHIFCADTQRFRASVLPVMLPDEIIKLQQQGYTIRLTYPSALMRKWAAANQERLYMMAAVMGGALNFDACRNLKKGERDFIRDELLKSEFGVPAHHYHHRQDLRKTGKTIDGLVWVCENPKIPERLMRKFLIFDEESPIEYTLTDTDMRLIDRDRKRRLYACTDDLGYYCDLLKFYSSPPSTQVPNAQKVTRKDLLGPKIQAVTLRQPKPEELPKLAERVKKDFQRETPELHNFFEKHPPVARALNTAELEELAKQGIEIARNVK